jgi:excinuclease ABC subunit B
MSATPGPYELNQTDHIAQQIIRPTGLLDPTIEVRPVMGQIDDLVGEINKRVERHERVFVTTLTKKMSEDLTDYLKDLGLKVKYLHSDIKTLERTQIIRDLRLGKFDVLVGINLLREGLDVPEVSLVAILDADKEGFLRNERSLIQTIGRAARNEHGAVIMYADTVTDSMQKAIDETKRRRSIQMKYNEEHHITPHTIVKPIQEAISATKKTEDTGKKEDESEFTTKDFAKLSKDAQQKMVAELTEQMQAAAKRLDFEQAATLRDTVMELKAQMTGKKTKPGRKVK